MLKRIFFWIVISSLTWASCTKETTAPPIDFQSNFYPLKIGAVSIFEVDSTAYSNFTNSSVNYQFEIKDSVTNTFEDLTGTTNYRIERYKKVNGASNWVFQLVFTRNKSIRAAEEFINNQRFIRLIFPPLAGAVWNGNSKNTIGQQEFIIENEVAALSLNNFNFDSTLVVTEIDEQNLIREDVVNVTYAKNVGLVQKEVKALDKNISTGKITNGFAYTLKIKSFK
ncbi:hypothetical protein [Pedobacter cryophilus]|uniref:Lipoprotein n=1 Tax=Pedobacter cryophilus TaxID=2571271 RepID=A0A4U1BTR8_9SPHI|nr:hypothetical protein [Pedobacter cryophilus]TKB95965.1 hypothetical protein FA046_14930 [Pedobacter cryophilus]